MQGMWIDNRWFYKYISPCPLYNWNHFWLACANASKTLYVKYQNKDNYGHWPGHKRNAILFHNEEKGKNHSLGMPNQKSQYHQ